MRKLTATARGNHWLRIRVRHSSRKESSFPAEMPLIKLVGAAYRHSPLEPRKFVALRHRTPRPGSVLTNANRKILPLLEEWRICIYNSLWQNIPSLAGFSDVNKKTFRLIFCVFWSTVLSGGEDYVRIYTLTGSRHTLIRTLQTWSTRLSLSQCRIIRRFRVSRHFRTTLSF